MNKEIKEILAKKVTIKIFAVILEEHNGYTPAEIKEEKLSEKCYGTDSFQKIYDIIYKNIGKK